MTFNQTLTRVAAAISILALAACGGGGGGGGGSAPVGEVTDPDYTDLSDRAAVGESATVTYVVLQDRTPVTGSASTLAYETGAISGGALDGTDIDDAEYTNPAGGEFSRFVTISSGDSLFGTVGLATENADLPPDGSTDYNVGWVAVTAVTDTEVYSLTGDADLRADWSGGTLRADFTDFSGTNRTGGSTGDVGNITLSNASISGSTFSGGSVTGTGIFAPLNGASTTTGTQGQFYGPLADEVGGVLLIQDDDVNVDGAFQAD